MSDLPTPPELKTLPADAFVSRESVGKLLVVLHGRGDSSAGFHWMPDAFQLPGLDYLMVNAPDDWYGGFSWYDLPPKQEPGVLRSRALLDGVFGEVFAAGYAPGDVALFGFSQGCLMTLEWGLRSAHQLAGYVGVSGYCLDPAALLAERHADHDPSRWLVTHGRQDGVCPYATSRDQMAALADGGFPLRFESYDKDHTIDPADELPLLRSFVAERLGLTGPG